MARDCGSFTGGAPPSSKMLRVSALCGWAWCWNQNVAPGPIAKLDRFPPSRHATCPVDRDTL
jgi:hypothetical protein